MFAGCGWWVAVASCGMCWCGCFIVFVAICRLLRSDCLWLRCWGLGLADFRALGSVLIWFYWWVCACFGLFTGLRNFGCHCGFVCVS